MGIRLEFRLQKFFNNAVKFLVISLMNVVFSGGKFLQPVIHKIQM